MREIGSGPGQKGKRRLSSRRQGTGEEVRAPWVCQLSSRRGGSSTAEKMTTIYRKLDELS